MKDGLLLVERMVLESLLRKEKNIEELERDTALNHGLLGNILPILVMKNIVKYHRGTYQLNMENKQEWIQTLNSKENIKEEVKELFVSLVNQYFMIEKKRDTQLKVKKVFLTPGESKILDAHLVNLDKFFIGLEEGRKYQNISERISEQKVVIWGHSSYSSLINGVLEAV